MDTLPNLTLPCTQIGELDLSTLKGKPVVLYFYPKDNTPGCTMEGKDFARHYDAFAEHGVAVYGVSRDKLVTHENYKRKHSFPFELISDVEETLCDHFDVIKGKTMFGRKVRGIQRSTFLFDSNGTLIRSWRKVKVSGHVEEVLALVRETF